MSSSSAVPFLRPQDEWGSILMLCQELSPDIVYLFPSSKEKAKDPKNQTEDNAYRVKTILREEMKNLKCHVLPLDVEDVTDYSTLYECFKNNLLRILNGLSSRCSEGLSGYDFYFNTASGTPQMSQVAQLYLSVSQIRPQFYNCVAPQFADADGRRVRLVEAPWVAETSLLSRLEKNAESGYFHSVRNDCASLAESTLLPERATIAQILEIVFTVYEKMDFVQYKEAFDAIQQIEPRMKSFSSVGSILKNQRAFLEHVKNNTEAESTHNLVDLYFNMRRAFGRGNYVDVLARFWRLREGILYYRLLANHGIDKRNLAKSRKESLQQLQDKASTDIVDWNTMRFKENLSVLSKALSDIFGDTAVKDFEKKFREDLESLRLVRNKTIVAHGMLPVAREDAALCLEIGEQLIDLIPEGRAVYERYPFTQENVKELVELLKRV